jgi:hypothetical protein
MTEPVLDVRFFQTDAGAEPVRDWLKELPAADRKTIGEDIKTVQFGWPLGMPLVRHVESDIWEVRIGLDNKIARVLFTLQGSGDGVAARLHQETAIHPEAGPEPGEESAEATERHRSWASKTSAAALTTSCKRKPSWKK